MYLLPWRAILSVSYASIRASATTILIRCSTWRRFTFAMSFVGVHGSPLFGSVSSFEIQNKINKVDIFHSSKLIQKTLTSRLFRGFLQPIFVHFEKLGLILGQHNARNDFLCLKWILFMHLVLFAYRDKGNLNNADKVRILL